MGRNEESFPEEDKMKVFCPRCGGVMVFEKFYGNAESFFGWRCVLCGEIVDQVIMENRLSQAQQASRLLFSLPFPESIRRR
jgi:hypothetical protein